MISRDDILSEMEKELDELLTDAPADSSPKILKAIKEESINDTKRVLDALTAGARPQSHKAVSCTTMTRACSFRAWCGSRAISGSGPSPGPSYRCMADEYAPRPMSNAGTQAIRSIHPGPIDFHRAA
jgi:hypothetical protein